MSSVACETQVFDVRCVSGEVEGKREGDGPTMEYHRHRYCLDHLRKGSERLGALGAPDSSTLSVGMVAHVLTHVYNVTARER